MNLKKIKDTLNINEGLNETPAYRAAKFAMKGLVSELYEKGTIMVQTPVTIDLKEFSANLKDLIVQEIEESYTATGTIPKIPNIDFCKDGRYLVISIN